MELVRTADRLSRGPARLLKCADLSAAQYNVLRILRGAPKGLLCGEIANRMISRHPDVTRLVDRMQGRGLLSRIRQAGDRRRVVVRIAAKGLDFLERLDDPVCRMHREQLGHLQSPQMDRMLELLRSCRTKVE
ncbi:MAG TPA: MarR family transcriptional regulator [Acidobacteriaceae bacterium]